MTELGREGFPAFVGRFRKRYALLIGLSLSIAAALVLSQFILVIHVTGNQSVSTSEICATLSRLGFGIGSYGPSVNERELVNRALLELEDVGFCPSTSRAFARKWWCGSRPRSRKLKT